MFFTIGFLACQILAIIGSQIETEWIFSLAGILTNLTRWHLQLENLENLIIVSQIWPNYPKDGCKSPFNLVEIIKTNLGFEEELEEFEGSFEEVEIVDIQNVEFFFRIFIFLVQFLLFLNIKN